ncbi:hypothetical protein T492DRAFT_1141449 [Pavlovales sp. CCMP2436]|nr:hypothetical protein T492DRAFT_1141449 [Pavlovales sp. CCMP2436]
MPLPSKQDSPRAPTKLGGKRAWRFPLSSPAKQVGVPPRGPLTQLGKELVAIQDTVPPMLVDEQTRDPYLPTCANTTANLVAPAQAELIGRAARTCGAACGGGGASFVALAQFIFVDFQTPHKDAQGEGIFKPPDRELLSTECGHAAVGQGIHEQTWMFFKFRTSPSLDAVINTAARGGDQHPSGEREQTAGEEECAGGTAHEDAAPLLGIRCCTTAKRWRTGPVATYASVEHTRRAMARTPKTEEDAAIVFHGAGRRGLVGVGREKKGSGANVLGG